MREKEREEERQKIFELWLSCWSQEEIAEKLDTPRTTIEKIINDTKRKLSQNVNNSPSSLRIYDVWQFSTCDDRYGSNYPGRIPGGMRGRHSKKLLRCWDGAGLRLAIILDC